MCLLRSILRISPIKKANFWICSISKVNNDTLNEKGHTRVFTICLLRKLLEEISAKTRNTSNYSLLIKTRSSMHSCVFYFGYHRLWKCLDGPKAVEKLNSIRNVLDLRKDAIDTNCFVISSFWYHLLIPVHIRLCDL